MDDSTPDPRPGPELQHAATLPLPQTKVGSGSRDEPSDDMLRPTLAHHLTEPTKSYSSPMRHHRRTPSQLHEVKETLDAHTEFASEDDSGSRHRVNQYTILEEIGRGSYGAVHLARDQFGQEFAVKEFSKARLRRRAQSHILRQGPRGPRRMGPGFGGPFNAGPRPNETNDALHLIREEIAIMKKLNHPNLVQLYEVLDDPEEDSIYIVLEMCRKGVVMQVGLDEQAEPYPEENCRYWFRDLILAIEYLHAQGVIHRDIKPDNLLLSEDDVLKVVDFGVSEMFEKPENMRTAKSAGSPAFLPPELCGKHADVSGTAADIWSMGVSLYCLKYGRIPFNRDGVLDMYDAIRSDEPQLPPDEKPDFVDLMHKILEKDPEKRITMDQLREHPWVTCKGSDPLLSTEENCANMVEPPNELEVSHAFTRKMNHLLCVMKVIHRFRCMLARHRAAAGKGSESGLSTPTNAQSGFNASEERAKAEVIEALLHQRRKIKASKLFDSSINPTPPPREDSEHETTFLGIGTGARDDFAMDKATPDMVSDSPVAVDFNVYDKAYEAAVEDIVSSQDNSSRKPTLYLTKFVKDTEHLKNVSDKAGGPGADILEDAAQQHHHHHQITDASDTVAQLASRLNISNTQSATDH